MANTENLPNEKQAGVVGSAWDGMRRIAGGGFFKGAIITAAIFVGVMALVAGAMGADHIGNLSVGGNLVTSFTSGVGHGIGKALEFLVKSPLGWASLAFGGAVGAVTEVRAAQHKLAEARTASLAYEYQHSKELQPQQSVQQEIQPARKKPIKRDESIYVDGSRINDKNFTACELKRRTEIEMKPECRTV